MSFFCILPNPFMKIIHPKTDMWKIKPSLRLLLGWEEKILFREWLILKKIMLRLLATILLVTERKVTSSRRE